MSDQNLFWLDLEMTGVDAQQHHILEIATLVTDKDLRVIEQGPSLVIQQSEEHLNGMLNEVRDMHMKTGLLNRVAQSTTSLGFAEKQTIAFLKKHCVSGNTMLCGNSIWVDRTFIKRYMAQLDACLHYRMIDVSTLKELAARWYPNIVPFEKKKSHIALEDIRESVAELQYYKQQMLIQNVG